MASEEKQSCPTCGQSVNIREIVLFSGMVRALVKVYAWAREKDVHEFTRKDIKHLFTNENETARFGDWILFGGLVYRPLGAQRGCYGLNFDRVEDFLSGRTQIPTTILKDPLKGTHEPTDYRHIKDIKNLSDLLTHGEFVAVYRHNEQARLV